MRSREVTIDPSRRPWLLISDPQIARDIAQLDQWAAKSSGALRAVYERMAAEGRAEQRNRRRPWDAVDRCLEAEL